MKEENAKATTQSAQTAKRAKSRRRMTHKISPVKAKTPHISPMNESINFANCFKRF